MVDHRPDSQVQRAIALTVFPDESAVLEIDGEKPIDLSPQEVEMLRALFKPQDQKKAVG